MKPYSKEAQENTTPEMALEHLREGNERFTSGAMRNRDLMQQVSDTSDQQYPTAVILSCIDSRLSSELVFDQGFGHIFSIRIAGNVIDDDVLASMEFACTIGGAKLIVVLGHSKCNAIQAACDNVHSGNLSTLLNKIQTSIYYERTFTEDRNSENSEFVETVGKIHVERSVSSVIKHSAVLREKIDNKEIGLIGAYYDVDTGKVEFLADGFVYGSTEEFETA